MPTTPTMNKPAQHQGTTANTQGEFDAYNHNVKNRNSKLARRNTWEAEEEGFEVKQEIPGKVDFYTKPVEQTPLDQNDFDLG
jgi:hypothetical protein